LSAFIVWPAPGRPAQSDGLAHGGEGRPRAFEVGGGTAHHDAERTVDGALDAARYRRVEQRHARRGEIARQLLGVDWIGRAHVEHQCPRRQALARGIAALDQRLAHDFAVREHGDQRIGALGRRLGRRCRQGRRMGPDEIRHRLLRDVEQAELIARTNEACRHRPAHHAEANEGDGGGRCEWGHAFSSAVRSYS
jgi:hypothetical protein